MGPRWLPGPGMAQPNCGDVASREEIATLTVRWAGSTVSSVAFSPDGTTVAVASEHRVGKWDVASLEEIGVPESQRWMGLVCGVFAGRHRRGFRR